MIDRMNFIKVVSVWLSAVFASLVSSENVELIFKLAAYALAAGYTAWRWCRDIKSKKGPDKKE
jgi:hypothetical protein